MSAVADWTAGKESLSYQACRACGHIFYIRRAFCPQCGASEPETKTASGRGVVYAETLVHRAPVAEAKADVPYKIVLVDCEEGFRVMGHGTHDLAIGDRVVAGYRLFLGGLVPLFGRA